MDKSITQRRLFKARQKAKRRRVEKRKRAALRRALARESKRAVAV